MRLNYNNGYYEGEVNANGDEHGYGTFVWNNGDKYVGYFKNRLFNGQGTYYYANGNKYVGSWVDDKKSGKGTMYFANGFIYDGQWKNDKRNGYGKETYKWGRYEGGFKDDDWYGYGKEYHNNGMTFEGNYNGYDNATDVIKTVDGRKIHGSIINKNFSPDSLNGYDTIDYDNGSYTGMFKDGNRHGQGVYNWTNGDTYDGNWENNDKSGYGVYTGSWGKYEGNYKNDRRYGYGKETLKNGEIYEGFWLDEKTGNDITKTQNGVSVKGVIADGKFIPNAGGSTINKSNFVTREYGNGTYEGEYSGNLRHGYGIYRWSSGARYEGYWVNDLRCGQGKFFWTDGSRYEGNWQNDKMNGYGIYYSANGSRYEGEWKDDNKTCGKQIYSWGSYEGEWANKTWCGHGIEIVNGGSTFEADWKDAKNAINVVKTNANGQKSYGKIVDGTFVAK